MAASPRQPLGSWSELPPTLWAAGYNEITRHPYGILKGVVDNKAFVKGTWGAQIVAEYEERAGQKVATAVQIKG